MQAARALPPVRLDQQGGPSVQRPGRGTVPGLSGGAGCSGRVNQNVEPRPTRAVEAHVSAQRLNQPTTDRKPQAAAAVPSSDAGIGLREGLKELRRLSLGMPAPVSRTVNSSSQPVCGLASRRRITTSPRSVNLSALWSQVE